MNLLLITDSQCFVDTLSNEIKNKDKKIDIHQSDLNVENIKKLEKKFVSSSVCVIYCENKIENFDMMRLSFIAGNLISHDVTIITNVKELEDIKICPKSKLHIKKDSESIINYVIKQYDVFNETAIKLESKYKLYSKGIPFTSDCFSIYMGKKNKEEICQLFINGGIDINSKDDAGTPILNNAVRNENINLVKQIIDLGADVNCVSEDRGYTPVMDAVWKGNKEITEYLIKKGADLNTINKEGQNNLVLAVGANKVEICKLLAENGANPDIKDSMGMSAYGYASLFKKTEILEILKPYHKE